MSNRLPEKTMSPFYPALFACLASAALSAAHAAPTWLTLVGDPHDPTADYIQFDPSGLARDNGLPTLPIRVSRVRPRTSQEGIVFRSFEAVVAVHCKKKHCPLREYFVLRTTRLQGNVIQDGRFCPFRHPPHGVPGNQGRALAAGRACGLQHRHQNHRP